MQLFSSCLEKPQSQWRGAGGGGFQPLGPALLPKHKKKQNKAICHLSSPRPWPGSGRQQAAWRALGVGRYCETPSAWSCFLSPICCFVLLRDMVRDADGGRK